MTLTQISTAGVKDDAVTSGKIPANAVGASELADNAVDTAAIVDDAVTNAKIADSAVNNAQLANNAVNVYKLANDAVSTPRIAAGAVTNVKIADQAVSLDKLPHGTSSNDGKFLRANNGADPSFETVTSTTINNNADNRVITGSGSANTLEAESGLTYDGSTHLAVQGSGQQQITIGSTNGSIAALILDGNSNGDGAGGDYSIIRHTSSGDLEFFARDPSGATNTIFKQGTSEAMRISDAGRVGIGKTPSSTLDIETANNANGFNLNCIGTPPNYFLNIRDDNVSKFYIKGSDGNVGIGSDAPANPLEVKKAAHYTTANSGQARSGIHIRGNHGNAGEYGGAISFGCKNSDGASDGAAAIAARQGTQDSDVVGLSFFTHPSSAGGDAAQEKLRIHHDGRIQPMYSSGAQATGGVMTVGAFNAKMNGHDSEGVLKARTDISHQSVFDAGGWYDNTNFRYNPQVKGYYIFHVTVMFFTGMNNNSVEQSLAIRLNGSTVHGYTDGYSTNYGNYSKHSFHGVVKCDGNNDYVDVTASSSASTQIHSASNWSGWLLYPEA